MRQENLSQQSLSFVISINKHNSINEALLMFMAAIIPKKRHVCT